MIQDVLALPVWNGRGERTIRTYIKTENGLFSATAPLGKSRGKWEAVTISQDETAAAFRDLKKAIISLDESDWQRVDTIIDELGGRNLEKTGASLAVATSMAVVKAAAHGQPWQLLSNGKANPLPFPIGNVAGGGAHGGSTSIQEFVVIPVKAASIEEAIDTNFSVWREVGKEMSKNGQCGRNDEGAWMTSKDDIETLELISKVAERHGCLVGMDVAAGQLMRRGKYFWQSLDKEMDGGEQMEFIRNLAETYKLAYIEDPLDAHEPELWMELSRKTKAMIVADDLTCSQAARVAQAAESKAANAILIKPDQAGTVSRALQAIAAAKKGGLPHVASHRSGDTCETFIADFAVGTGASLIKCGISGGERTSKLNRLLEIWATISEKGKPEMAKLRLQA